MKRSILLILFLTAFGTALLLPYQGSRDLWNPDEPRYAEVAREMMVGETWLVPHLNGAVYLEKPPLFFWLIAGSAKIFGSLDSFTARLPTVLFGILTLVLTFIIGTYLFGGVAGVLGALVLATNAEFLWLAQVAKMDVPLTFFTVLSVFSFYRGFRSPHTRRRWYVAAYGAMALGVLTKGQVAVIIPLLVIAGYFLVSRQFSFFVDRAHLAGLVFFGVLLVAWIAVTALGGGDEYLTGFLYGRTTERWLTGDPSHQRPLYYYLVRFPGNFLPWTLFLPSAIIYGLSHSDRRREWLFLLFWCAVVFVVFSLVKGKRESYLLPIYPAAALMIGNLWAHMARGEVTVSKRLVTVPLRILLGLFILVAIGMPLVSIIWGSRYVPQASILGALTGLMVAIAACLVLISYRRARFSLCLLTLVALVGTFAVYSKGYILPTINQYKSARPLSEQILSLLHPGDRLGIYRMEGAEYNFYTGMDTIQSLETEEQFQTFLGMPDRVFCIMKDRHYSDLKDTVSPGMIVILTGQVGHRELFIVSNRGGSGSPPSQGETGALEDPTVE